MSSSVVPSPVLWLEGEIKDCFPILHIGLVPQGWIQSNVDSIKTHPILEKSGVAPCWLVQGCMVCFSLPDLERFHPNPQFESMSKRGNNY